MTTRQSPPPTSVKKGDLVIVLDSLLAPWENGRIARVLTNRTEPPEGVHALVRAKMIGGKEAVVELGGLRVLVAAPEPDLVHPWEG